MRHLATFFSLFFTLIATAQTWTEHSYEGDGVTLHYWLVSPSQSADNLPVIIYLHGGSGKGDDLQQVIGGSFPKQLRDGLHGDLPAHVIIPQLPSSFRGWSQVSETLRALILDAAETTHADLNRIALTGHSMGGTGSWEVAVKLPGLFCSVAPLSGSITLNDSNLEALSRLPVWAIVGSADRVVKPESSINFVAALQERGADARITVLDGYAHQDVPQAYLDPTLNLIEWLLGGETAAIVQPIEKLQVTFPTYDLQGRRLSAPKRGINIHRGRKYLWDGRR